MFPIRLPVIVPELRLARPKNAAVGRSSSHFADFAQKRVFLIILRFLLRFQPKPSTTNTQAEEQFSSGLISLSVVTRRLPNSVNQISAAEDKQNPWSREGITQKEDSVIIYKVTVSGDVDLLLIISDW